MGSSKEKVKHCPVCAFASADSFEFDVHKTSQRHIYNDMVKKFQTIRKSKVKDRHGVSIAMTSNGHEVIYTPSNGSVKVAVNWSVKEVDVVFCVKNVNKPAELLHASLLHPLNCFTLMCTTDGKQPQIGAGESREVRVTFNSPGVGIYSVPVCFQLKKTGREFQIIRELFVEVTSQPVLGPEEEEEKDSPFTSEAWYAMRKCIPATKGNGEEMKKITQYPVPRSYEPLFKHNMYAWDGDPPMTQEQVDLLHKLLGTLPERFNYEEPFKEVYCDFFHMVLYMNEYFTVKGLHHYHMSDVPLHIVSSKRIELEVPGLAEKRPSVIKGDLVSVRVHVGPDSWETIEYEGVIAEVRDSVVWIKGFSPRFIERLQEEGDQLRFDVRFLFNRYPTFLMHRAIDWGQEEFIDTIIFPRAKLLPALIPDFSFPFFNKLVYNNAEQRKAVINIVRGEARPAPYIVFGPPGTGKTNTIVEAILQVKTVFKRSFILVCAASNAACDNITQKLMQHCTPAELLRLHSPSRDIESIPKDVTKYSNCLTVTKFDPQDKKKYRILVCTLINAGSKLAEARHAVHRSVHHYTHVFIDEAGQALEPEIFVALAGILGPARSRNIGGQLILAGDPKQLGPVCTSVLAEEFGLGVSFLERLMMYCPLYQRDEQGNYNPLYITKLLQNFRSHPSLLQLPNRLFYDEELQPSCSPAILNDKVGTLHLLGKRTDEMHNCIFHGVIGQERREGKSPSFYNQQELDAVIHDVTILLNSCSLAEVKQTDIGIISPYIRQVYKLKYCLESRGWTDIEVGTTETFQGREKRIILISTVRSNRNLLDYDKKYKLGFLDNRKRFNVAITRARSLLIVIGCPHVLEMDTAWAELIANSKATNSYKGCSYNVHKELWTKEVLRRLQKPILTEES